MVIKEPTATLPHCCNRKAHISAFPAFDRERCPYCKVAYIRKRT